VAKVRKITSSPADGRNYYLVDANFLVNKHIPPTFAPAGRHQDRIVACQAWWKRIDAQLKAGIARVYVPDVCIAEAFKVLANKYYQEKWFTRHADFDKARNGLSDDIRTPAKVLKAFDRPIRFHDLSTNRDIIVGVDRFFEIFHKHGKNVQIVDLILVATAKYLMEFFDIPRDRLHIVTLDTALREGIAKVAELPTAYDPTLRSHRADVVFS
jgi:predicted nucleic acid-binding protein